VAREGEEANSPWPEFFNQRDSFKSQTLGRRACGPTAFAMAINILRKRNHIQTRTTPLEVLWKASEATVLPNHQIQYKLLTHGPDGISGYIPVGDTTDNTIHGDIAADQAQGLTSRLVRTIPETNKYDPIFTLTNGWDHRGSKKALASYNLTAEQFGDTEKKVTLKELTTHLKSKNLLIASVNHTEDSSHLVLITEYKQDNGDWLLIHDPKEHGPQWISASEWYSQSFRGYGTVIYNSQNKEN